MNNFFMGAWHLANVKIHNTHTLAGHNTVSHSYTTVPCQLHQAKENYIPSSEIRLLSHSPFLQANADMWPF